MIVKQFKVTTPDNRSTWIRLKLVKFNCFGRIVNTYPVFWSGNGDKWNTLTSYSETEAGKLFLSLVRTLGRGGINQVKDDLYNEWFAKTSA